MWCPKCESEYREGFTVCPVCQVPLVETLEPAAEPEEAPVFLMRTQDPKALSQAQALLDGAGIPYFLREPGGGELLRIATGANFLGSELYVSPADLRTAMRLLRVFDPDEAAPFDEEELNRAVESFASEYPGETEESGPATPEGYRIALVFLVIFGSLAALAILIPLLRSLLI